MMTVSYPDGCYILSVAALVLSRARLLHLFAFMRLLRYVSSSLQDGLMTGILQASVSRLYHVIAVSWQHRVTAKLVPVTKVTPCSPSWLIV